MPMPDRNIKGFGLGAHSWGVIRACLKDLEKTKSSSFQHAIF